MDLFLYVLDQYGEDFNKSKVPSPGNVVQVANAGYAEPTRAIISNDQDIHLIVMLLNIIYILCFFPEEGIGHPFSIYVFEPSRNWMVANLIQLSVAIGNVNNILYSCDLD